MAKQRKNAPTDAAETIERLAAEGHSRFGISKFFGISSHNLKQWLDDNETLYEAFEQGKEVERKMLHDLIMQSAKLNKGPNVNAFFLLKTRHGYKEATDASAKQNVNVAVNLAPVLVIPDHGTDEQWAAKSAEQQRKLTIDAGAPPYQPVPRLDAPSYLPDWSPISAQASTAPPCPTEPARVNGMIFDVSTLSWLPDTAPVELQQAAPAPAWASRPQSEPVSAAVTVGSAEGQWLVPAAPSVPLAWKPNA